MTIADADRRAAAALPPTERRLEASMGLDDLDTAGVLRLLHDADRDAVDAAGAVLPQLAALVEVAAARMRAGGAVHYFGAGTSGRLGVLDAVELVPTFQLEPGRVVPHIAGGERALTQALEGVEDQDASGEAAASALGPNDVAIGLTASGTTPYVAGALRAARRAGAVTALISSNPASPLAPLADHVLALDTGAEVVTGSTRLKAGTAEKLVLNGFSTALMVRLGRTWSNLMVSVLATNAKLRARSVRILRAVADLDEEQALEAIARANGDLKTAIVAELAGVDADTARARIAARGGSVREAIADGRRADDADGRPGPGGGDA